MSCLELRQTCWSLITVEREAQKGFREEGGDDWEVLTIFDVEVLKRGAACKACVEIGVTVGGVAKGGDGGS